MKVKYATQHSFLTMSQFSRPKEITVTVLNNAQCGSFMIFLSLRFYVKSILRISEVQTAIFAILRTVNFVPLVYYSLQKVQNFIKIKIHNL